MLHNLIFVLSSVAALKSSLGIKKYVDKRNIWECQNRRNFPSSRKANKRCQVKPESRNWIQSNVEYFYDPEEKKCFKHAVPSDSSCVGSMSKEYCEYLCHGIS